jgi:hypothetical protein
MARRHLVRLILALAIAGGAPVAARGTPAAHAAPIVCVSCVLIYPHISVTEAGGLVTVTGASFTAGGLVYVKIIGMPGTNRDATASDPFPSIDAYFPMRADGTDDPVFTVGASTFNYQTLVTSQRCFDPVFASSFPDYGYEIGLRTPDHLQVSAYDIGSRQWSNTWDLYPGCPANWAPGVYFPLR